MNNYFAAANTERGFVSWFDDIFDSRSLDYTYIIKGGSGTGKSTLMKKAAAKGASLGAACEYYFCSSDPDSLDGVILKMPDGRRIAMLDGTAPHTHDPRYPGASEAIVNLGEYWCEDILRGQRRDIIALTSKKSELFGEAYSYFGAAGRIVSTNIRAVSDITLGDKLYAACERLLTQRMHECGVKPGKSEGHIRCLSALSTKGEVHFDSFCDCEKVCLVTDFYCSAPLFFDALIRCAKNLGLTFERAPVPLMPDYSEAVRFPKLSMSVVSHTDREDIKIINMTRFVERNAISESMRHSVRTLKKCAGELTGAGLSRLAEVKSVHGELERIYGGAMDFTRLGAASDRLIERIFV